MEDFSHYLSRVDCHIRRLTSQFYSIYDIDNYSLETHPFYRTDVDATVAARELVKRLSEPKQRSSFVFCP